MSGKMRWCMKAFWVFLTLSIFHSALAAPVAVEELLEVRLNPAEVPKDGIAMWEKRMGPNGKDQSSMTDVQLPDASGGAPGGVQEDVEATGVKEKGAPGWKWKWPWQSEALGSDSNGPDTSNNNPPKVGSDGGGGSSNGNNDRGGGGGGSPEHPAARPGPITTLLDKWISRGGPRSLLLKLAKVV